MKNLLFKTLAVTVVMMFVCTSAFAAVLTTEVADNTLTVTVTGLTAGEESTLLVVDEGTKLADVANDTSKIFYVDQVTATDGTATYTIDVTDAGDIDVFSGYTTMAAGDSALFDAVEEEGGDDPVVPPVDPDEPDVPDVPATYTLGDVNNDTKVNAIDAGLIVDKFLNGTDFVDATTGEIYADGEKAADVNVDTKVNAIDAGLVVDFFLNGTEFPVAAE